eukprot:Filipodium_phascolosomae@DN4402_c0_g1_i1.p1
MHVSSLMLKGVLFWITFFQCCLFDHALQIRTKRAGSKMSVVAVSGVPEDSVVKAGARNVPIGIGFQINGKESLDADIITIKAPKGYLFESGNCLFAPQPLDAESLFIETSPMYEAKGLPERCSITQCQVEKYHNNKLLIKLTLSHPLPKSKATDMYWIKLKAVRVPNVPLDKNEFYLSYAGHQSEGFEAVEIAAFTGWSRKIPQQGPYTPSEFFPTFRPTQLVAGQKNVCFLYMKTSIQSRPNSSIIVQMPLGFRLDTNKACTDNNGLKLRVITCGFILGLPYCESKHVGVLRKGKKPAETTHFSCKVEGQRQFRLVRSHHSAVDPYIMLKFTALAPTEFNHQVGPVTLVSCTTRQCPVPSSREVYLTDSNHGYVEFGTTQDEVKLVDSAQSILGATAALIHVAVLTTALTGLSLLVAI